MSYKILSTTGSGQHTDFRPVFGEKKKCALSGHFAATLHVSRSWIHSCGTDRQSSSCPVTRLNFIVPHFRGPSDQLRRGGSGTDLHRENDFEGRGRRCVTVSSGLVTRFFSKTTFSHLSPAIVLFDSHLLSFSGSEISPGQLSGGAILPYMDTPVPNFAQMPFSGKSFQVLKLWRESRDQWLRARFQHGGLQAPTTDVTSSQPATVGAVHPLGLQIMIPSYHRELR